MANCLLEMTVGDKVYTFENFRSQDGENISLEKILESLSKKKNTFGNIWSNIISEVTDRELYNKKNKGYIKEAIESGKSIISNYTVSQLSERYDSFGNLPNFNNTKVLLVSKIKSKANKTLGFGTRVVQGNSEIFIVDQSSISDFAIFLKVINKLSRGYESSPEDDKIVEVINKQFPNKKLRSFAELLGDYAINSQDYDQLTYNQIKRIDEEYNRVAQHIAFRMSYADEVINEINDKLIINKGNTIFSISSLINVLQKSPKYVELFGEDFLTKQKNGLKGMVASSYKETSQFKFEDGQTLSQKLETPLNENNQDTNTLSILFDFITKDSDFPYEVESVSTKNKNIYLKLKNQYKPLIEKYSGLTFKTVVNFEYVQPYKGYHIFKSGDYFYASKSYIHGYSKNVIRSTSESLLKSNLNLKASREKLNEDSSLFRQVNKIEKLFTDSKSKYDPIDFKYTNTLSTVLRLPENTKLKLNKIEKDFIRTASVYDFFSKPNKITGKKGGLLYNSEWAAFDMDKSPTLLQDLKDTLYDAQSVVAFLYLLNSIKVSSDDLTTVKDIKETLIKLKEIQDPRRTTWVDTINPFSYSVVGQQLTEVTLADVNDYLYSEQYQLQLLKRRLKDLGVTVLLLSEDHLSKLDQYKDVDFKTVKAFVSNNEIVINTSRAKLQDGIHEYVHIILGLLKANNPELYNNILSKFEQLISTDDELSALFNDIDSVRYKDFSHIDKLEETFAEKFSDYIVNKRVAITGNIYNDKLSDLFSEVGDNVVKDEKLSTLLNSDLTLMQLLEKVEKMIKLMSTNKEVEVKGNSTPLTIKSLFPNTSESLIKQRKITNFIKSQINEGKLIEKCK